MLIQRFTDECDKCGENIIESQARIQISPYDCSSCGYEVSLCENCIKNAKCPSCKSGRLVLVKKIKGKCF